jgi:hypothetical protein
MYLEILFSILIPIIILIIASIIFSIKINLDIDDMDDNNQYNESNTYNPYIKKKQTLNYINTICNEVECDSNKIDSLSRCGGYINSEKGCCGGTEPNETCCNEVDEEFKLYKLNELMDDSDYCKKTQYCNNVICRSDLENLNEDELNNIAKQWGIDIYQDQSTIINTLMQYLYYK